MPNIVDSFIYGVDDMKDWAYGRLYTIFPKMRYRVINKNGVTRRIYSDPEDIGPMAEGALYVTEGTKVVLFDDGAIAAYAREEKK